jgi:thymidine kinase
VRRAQIARQKVQLFKPRIDARFSHSEIVSHSEMKLPSQVVERASEIPPLVARETEVVAIDEGQFFDATLVEVVDSLANRGLRVIVAGLDQDYRGRPFEPMPQLMAVAEYVDKTLAVCMRCGGAGEYEARCRACFDPNGDEAK